MTIISVNLNLIKFLLKICYRCMSKQLARSILISQLQTLSNAKASELITVKHKPSISFYETDMGSQI